jgi:hypothetical protein
MLKRIDRIRMEGLGEWMSRQAAWLLPRRVALWAMVRVAAHATTGKWGNESPDAIGYKEMHDRWGVAD